MKNDRTTTKIGVVFTTITGNYDELHNHSYANPDWDYICYTDNCNIRDSKNSLWQIRPLIFNKLDDIRNQRWHKIHPHILFPDYERSLWIDGNIDIIDKQVFANIEHAIQMKTKISIPLHPFRNCIYDELDACIGLGKDDKKIMEEQIQLIRRNGFPANQGLFACGLIYREHHDKQVMDTMEEWWWWIEHHSRRDQLSLPYVLWTNDLAIKPLSDKTFYESGKVVFTYAETHITKEEILAKMHQEIENLKQEIRLMKLSRFWKMRELYLKLKKYFLDCFQP